MSETRKLPSLTVPQSPLPEGGGRFLLPLCLDYAGLTALLSLLQFGAFEAGYYDADNLYYDVLEALAFINQPERTQCASAPPAPPVRIEKEIILKHVAAYREEQKEMCRLRVTRIGGVAYLEEDCGCGTPNRYQLLPVESDATGNPVPTQDGGKDADTWQGISPAQPAEYDCFRDNAVDFLIGDAEGWISQYIDFVLFAVDFVTPDEFSDLAGIIKTGRELITDYPSLAQQSKAAIMAAVASQQTRDALRAAFTYDSYLTREQYRAWVRSAPLTVNGIPVRPLYEYWAGILLGGLVNSALNIAKRQQLNYRLGFILQECRGQVEQPSLPLESAPITVGGNPATFYWFSPDLPQDYTSSEILFPRAFDNILAVYNYYEYDSSPGGMTPAGLRIKLWQDVSLPLAQGGTFRLDLWAGLGQSYHTQLNPVLTAAGLPTLGGTSSVLNKPAVWSGFPTSRYADGNTNSLAWGIRLKHFGVLVAGTGV